MAFSLRDSKNQKLILVGLLGAAVLYVYFLTEVAPFTYKASAAELKDLSGQYKKLSADLTKARQSVNSLPYLEKESELLHEKWDRAQRLLPNEQETASLLRAVTLLGDKSGVSFLMFKPLAPHPAQYYTEHPIEVKVDGGYHEVGTFLGELANMERIVTVSDLNVAAPKSNETDRPTITSFVAKTYTLGGTGVPPEEAAKLEKGGAAKKVEQAKQLGKKLKSKQRGESDND